MALVRRRTLRQVREASAGVVCPDSSNKEGQARRALDMGTHKGLVQRIERKLEVTVGDAFARVFGGAIVPEEVEAMLRREAAQGVRSLQGNRLLAPNEYIITLGAHDYQRLGTDPDVTAETFAKYLAGYIGEQGWQTYGDVVVRFEESPSLHTGQFRTRGGVNPDVEPRPTASDFAPPQSDHAFNAEPGVPPMTENSSYRGGQGQGRPGDEYYDDRYGRAQDDPRGGQESRGGQEPRGGYPPESGGYPQSGYPPRPPEHGAYPDQSAYPDQGGYDQRGYPGQGGYPEQRGYDQGGYPEPGRYGEPPRYPDQGGYPDQGAGGYPPPYEQRPPAGYGAPGYDAGYRQGGYGPPAGPGYPEYDYGRGPARPDEAAGYGQPERAAYPEPGGYESYGAGYGRQDYGGPDYGRYGEGPAGGVYAPPGGGYAEPPARDYEYGQPAATGYGGYGETGYPSTGRAVTLQLDDGSGRTYQLREGSNIIGRGQDAQFRLPDTGVSRRHLEIRWDGQVALLTDLNSTNGTTVNNAPVQEWQLADGDVIRLGHSEIIVHFH
jgi:hypothetical protein